jgi:hypothetical protein
MHYLLNADHVKKRVAEYKAKNPEKVFLSQKRDRKKHPYRHKFYSVKSNAKKRGIEFLLTKEDVVNLLDVDFCPICGRSIDLLPIRNCPDSKSIDRIDPTGPYSRDNCACICLRCNIIKGFGNAEEHEKISKWMKSRLLK